MPDKIRVIFVDDEANVLAALRRLLRSKRNDWEMVFVESGPKALEQFAMAEFDVIVSDIRMPGMDGGELLSIVKERHPGTIRIALSGQVDLNEVIRSIRAVHQYISKPCEALDMIRKIEGAVKSREILADPELQEIVTSIELPVIPRVYQAIKEELDKDEPSIEVIAKHISMDIGMVAKILKLVNSPYFGLPSHIDSLFQAITMLGLETIQALIITTHMFSMYKEDKLPIFSIDLLWEHSFRVSNIARLIAQCESLEMDSIRKARMGGLLHDVGKLLLANHYPEKYAEVIRLVKERQTSIWECEMEVFGASHAHLGAHIIGLWGMSGEIVHGIGYHHKYKDHDMSVCMLISIADFIDHHCVVINDDYVKIDLKEGILPPGDAGKLLEKWISYINDNWDGVDELPMIDADILTGTHK